MNRARVAVIFMVALVFFTGLVSAGYITVYQKYIGVTLTSGSSYTVDFSNVPYSLSDNLYIETTFSQNVGDGAHDSSSYMYINLNADTIVVRVTYSYLSDEYATFIDFNGNNVCYSGYSSTNRFTRVVAFMVNSTHMNVTAYGGTTMLCSIVLDVSGSSYLQSINYRVTTYHTLSVDTLYIKRFSDRLTSLNVYDENTGAAISPFDFSENNNVLRVYDLQGYYPARSYIITTGMTSLDAYLVYYTQGAYYTISTLPNAKVEVFKNIDGVYKLVTSSTTDENGITSAFLNNGDLYLFRVTDDNGTIREYFRTADPNNREINLLTALLNPVTLTSSKLADISYSIEPSTLYIGQNNTITVNLISPNGYLKEAKAELKVNGKLISNATLSGSPSGGTITFNYNASGLTLMDRVWLTLTITSTDNVSVTITKNFLLDYPSTGSSGLKESIEKAPSILGLGTVGSLILVTFAAMFIIIAIGARGAGAIAILLGVYGIFTYLGWLDWRITAVAFLAGLGIILRREE